MAASGAAASGIGAGMAAIVPSLAGAACPCARRGGGGLPRIARFNPPSETPMLKQEFDALLPSRDFTRRDFVRTSVGSGFAAAVLPVAAQTVIKTASDGLVAGEVTIPVGDFKMPAYRAAPAGKTGAPVVLVISEIFGVHEHIADVARRFAKAGYFAIAPELFVRQGDAGSYGEIAKLIAEVVVQGARRPGHGRPRRLRRLGQGPGRRHRQARRHRLLLGRAHHLAVCGAQPGGEGRRRLVRAPGRPGQRAAADAPGRAGRQAQRRRCSACTAARTAASRWPPSSR